MLWSVKQGRPQGFISWVGFVPKKVNPKIPVKTLTPQIPPRLKILSQGRLVSLKFFSKFQQD